MKTRRHHFSVTGMGGLLTAHVPDEGSEARALERLKKDDPIWCGSDVQYHGIVEWFELIAFQFEPGATARTKMGLGEVA